MKKKLLTLSLFLALAPFAHAQWVTSGTNVTYSGGNVGIGPTTPQSMLHLSGTGTSFNQTGTFDPKSLIIQGNTGGRNQSAGAQLEFAIPANTDGSNIWGQARIITVAGNADNANASGKMMLSTRRYFNKLGTGNNWYYGDDLTLDGKGNVGIGTTTPSNTLTVDPQGKGGISIGNSNAGSGGFTDLILSISAKQNGYSTIESIQSSGATYGNLFLNPNGGSIGIGTLDAKGYKLAVNGNAIATSMTVKLNSAWPDYVFKKEYKLPSLQEVKSYIDKNQHLPEMPSEEQIAKNGVNLGEMNKLLMKKVEELTLYLIENDKKDKLKDELLEKLQLQIDELKNGHQK